MAERLKFIDVHNRETIFPISIAKIDIPDDLKRLDHIGGIYRYEAIRDGEIEIDGKIFKFKKGDQYVGVFFGKFGYHPTKGNYWHSSTNEVFRALFFGKEPILKYTIFKLFKNEVTMKKIYNEEHIILVANTAKQSENYWNDSNGFKQYDEPDIDRVIEVADKIKKAIDNYMKGKSLGVKGIYLKKIPLNTIDHLKETKNPPTEKFHKNQVKDEINAEDIIKIRDRIDEFGMEKVEPTIAWENAEALNEHWICNGHTTLKALKRVKNIDWSIDVKDVLMVTDEVYGDLDKDDCKSVNGILNAEEEPNSKVGGKTNIKTAQKKLKDMYFHNNWTDNLMAYQTTYNKLLKAFGLSQNDRDKAVRGAANDIGAKKRSDKNEASTKIDYSLNEEQERIVEFIESLYTEYPKNKSIFQVISAKSMNGAFNKVFDAIGQTIKGNRLTLVDNYNDKGKINIKEPKIWKFIKDPDLKPKNIENIVILPDFRKDEITKQEYEEGKYVRNLKVAASGHWENFKNRLILGGILKSFQEYQNKKDSKFENIKNIDQKDLVSIPLPFTRLDTDV